MSALRRTLWLLRTLPPGASWWLLRRALESREARRQRLTEALAAADGRLVFVCHGNIMRSAFCAEVARHAVARHEIPGEAERIVSGGTHASLGSSAEKTAREVAQAFGVDLEAHRSSPLGELSLTGRDVVVCMDRGNEARVLQFLGQGQRVFLVGDIDELRAEPDGAMDRARSGAGHDPASAGGETRMDGEIEPVGDEPSREVPDPYGKGADVTRRAFLRLRSRAELWARRHFPHA